MILMFFKDSEVVLMGMTEKYKLSPNYRLEALCFSKDNFNIFFILILVMFLFFNKVVLFYSFK
jgi:hypothetical protein